MLVSSRPSRAGSPVISATGLIGGGVLVGPERIRVDRRGGARHRRHGHISKQGSVWVRWILCEAARKAKHSPQFAASYQSIARCRGTEIATTAIARKLLTRAYHLLTDAASAGAPS